MHSTQGGLKVGTTCPLNQQIPGLENREPGLDEGQKLLVEDQKVLARDGAATPPSGIQDRHTSAAAQSKDEQAAFFQLCANRELIIALQPAFQDGAVSLRGSVKKHRHLAGGS